MVDILKKYNLQIKKVIDFVIVILITLLSIKKGGFYKGDSIAINLFVCIIGLIWIALCYKSFKQKIAGDLNFTFLFILSFCYLLPIFFNNYTNLSDAVFEFIRYFNLLICYIIVKNSDNKKVYTNGIIVIAVVQCILGIDQIAKRYFENILEVFNSGYLSIDIDRMSGTIQYANTLAILLGIASIFVLEKIYTLFKVKDNNVKSAIKISLLSLIYVLFLTCIILTKTRYAALITLIATIVFIVKNFGNKKIIGIKTIIDIIISFIIAGRATSFLGGQEKYIYLTFFICLVVYFGLCFVFNLFINKIISKISFNKKCKIVLLVICTFLVVLYFVLAVNLENNVVLNDNNKSYSANVFAKVNETQNNISINIDEKEIDSRYYINVYQISRDNQKSLIKRLNYYDNITGVLKIEGVSLDKQKYKSLNFEFVLEKGNIKVDDVSVNGKKYVISYFLIPYDFIQRIIDGITGSDSVSTRVTYLSDAVKIIFNGPKNFFFGTGGEGFKNSYNQFKTINYSSTEVHNSYMQIFCESGIFGFISIIFVIIYSLIKSNKNTEMLAFVMVVCHSIMDLNFSYMLMLLIFALLLGCLDYKKNNKKTSKIICEVNIVFFIVFSIANIYIMYKLFLANVASSMVEYSKDDKESTGNTLQYTDKIKFYKLKFDLDSTEYKYGEQLIEAKEEYIKFLKLNYNEENYEIMKSQIHDIEKTINYLVKTNKYNKNVLFLACKVYYRNLDDLVLVNHEKNEEEGKKFYKEKIEKYLNDILKYNPLNENTKKNVEEYKNKILL